jgi:putative membrane protein
MDEPGIYQIQRPSPMLLKLYIIRSILSGPFIIFSLPVLLFRYHTLKYRFDSEGISMKWGLIFRREINLTFARIQDIHLTSGVIQRWLGLADLKIQTASGSAEPEMTLEGIVEYEALRDFLYTKMRGYRELSAMHVAPPVVAGQNVQIDAEAVKILTDISNELRATREALERLANK